MEKREKGIWSKEFFELSVGALGHSLNRKNGILYPSVFHVPSDEALKT